MPYFRNMNTDIDDFYEHTRNYRLFQTGALYPPVDDLARIAKYRRGRTIYNARYSEPAYLGKHNVLSRATDILAGTPHAEQLNNLYIAVNLMDILVTKPADLMVGEPPQFESGKPDNAPEQKALSRLVDRNSLPKRIHESVIGNGYRG
ncbi:MAG TPA: phage portal protein, partial [Bacillales bacterium]|nr:phage portal protein [Bacillales bacterium]